MTITIRRDSPFGDGLDLLFQRHQLAMQADTPPESIHMLPRAELDDPAIAFFVMREDDRPVAMGAVKDLGGGEAEIKSMHVLSECRGRGLSRMLLRTMLAHAREAGLTRLSLETGAQPGFAAARMLYSSAGFAECPPFGSYRPDPNSVFMTVSLT